MGRFFAAACAALALLALVPSPQAARPLRTAIVMDSSFSGPERNVVFRRVREAGITMVRVQLNWADVAKTAPANAASPTDPAYDWTVADSEIRGAVSHGLEPVVSIDGAPKWAQHTSPPVPFIPADPPLVGPIRPDPRAYGRFARAAAIRYGGGFRDLPRVRLWRASNEPNLSVYLLPQFKGKEALSPEWYRAMLNAFAVSVHRIHRDNVVVAGGLAPFGTRTKFAQVVPPLRFMRELLCLSGGAHPRPTCRARSEFDVWGVHPYTSGGPTRKASQKDGIALGDLDKVRLLLDAAARSGHVKTSRSLGMWVTEFSWDTRPPDLSPRVVPIKLHARWVAEALHQMWLAGVTVVTWLQLRDAPFPVDPYQSGLYFRGGDSMARDAPKPAAVAYRFPFVAYRDGKGYSVWGRTPSGAAASVAIERNSGAGWRRIGIVRSDRYGIFSGLLKAPAGSPKRPTTPPPVPSGAYRNEVMRDSPTSYWPLDDPAGARARDLAGARSGVYEGGARHLVPGALPGTLDRAVALDGKDDRVALGPVSSPSTVELWLKTNATNEAAAFSNRDGESRYAFLGVWGAVRARAFDGFGLSGRTWITDGRWHHLVYTYDGVRGRLYVDGRLDDTAAMMRAAGGAAAWLGYDATLGTHLRGSIDEVALYSYPLAAARVRAHFLASGRPRGYADQFAIMNPGATYLRARVVGRAGASLPFSLKRPRDRFVLPFGV